MHIASPTNMITCLSVEKGNKLGDIKANMDNLYANMLRDIKACMENLYLLTLVETEVAYNSHLEEDNNIGRKYFSLIV